MKLSTVVGPTLEASTLHEVGNDAAMTATSSTSAGALARGLDVIECVADAETMSVANLARQLGLSRSAAYRIVAQLRDRGYLAENGNAHVRLGPVAIRVGLLALEGLDLFKVTPGPLQALVDKTQETAFVAVPDEDEMVYVMQEVGPQVVKVSSKLGSRAPFHASGLGKAYLSGLEAEQRADIVSRLTLTAYTTTTLTTTSALLRDIDEAARVGFAVDDSEREPGVRCLAAPIRDASGHPIAAISVAGPRERITAAEAAIADALANTALEISIALGHHPH